MRELLEDIVEIIQMAKAGPVKQDYPASQAMFKRGDVFNPWADEDPLDCETDGPSARRLRLLSHFSVPKPKLLLIGEAPGYQGCHYTGVPFTNESLILDCVVPRMPIGRITTRELPWREPSATIVWGALHDAGLRESTVMWNAFPWHPHKPGDLHTNRTPTASEMKEGLHLLSFVIRTFVSQGALIVAVGKKAEASIRLLGNRDFYCVRHPSMGGANDFRDGMKGIAGELGR